MALTPEQVYGALNKKIGDLPVLNIDNALSTTSENAVQNKVVTGALDDLATFTGTTAQWNALTALEKGKYRYVNLTDEGDSNVIGDLTISGDFIFGGVRFKSFHYAANTTPMRDIYSAIASYVSTNVSIPTICIGKMGTTSFNGVAKLTDSGSSVDYLSFTNNGAEKTTLWSNAASNCPFEFSLVFIA